MPQPSPPREDANSQAGPLSLVNPIPQVRILRWRRRTSASVDEFQNLIVPIKFLPLIHTGRGNRGSVRSSLIKWGREIPPRTSRVRRLRMRTWFASDTVRLQYLESCHSRIGALPDLRVSLYAGLIRCTHDAGRASREGLAILPPALSATNKSHNEAKPPGLVNSRQAPLIAIATKYLKLLENSAARGAFSGRPTSEARRTVGGPTAGRG